MTNQSERQQSTRDVTGNAGTWAGDWHKLFDDRSIAAGTFNSRMLAWINDEIGLTFTSLPSAQAGFANRFGLGRWSGVTAAGVVNKLRNPSLAGGTAGVIGSGGAMPTNMGVTAAGLTVTVAYGTAEGAPYMQLRFQGTTAATNAVILFETATQITAVQGDVLTVNQYVQRTAGDWTNVSELNIGGIEVEAGAFEANNFTDDVLSEVNTGSPLLTSPLSSARTMADPDTEHFQPRMRFLWSNGVVVDFTIRVALPRCD